MWSLPLTTGCLCFRVIEWHRTFISTYQVLQEVGISSQTSQIFLTKAHTKILLFLCEQTWNEFGTDLLEAQVSAQNFVQCRPSDSSFLRQLPHRSAPVSLHVPANVLHISSNSDSPWSSTSCFVSDVCVTSSESPMPNPDLHLGETVSSVHCMQRPPAFDRRLASCTQKLYVGSLFNFFLHTLLWNHQNRQKCEKQRHTHCRTATVSKLDRFQTPVKSRRCTC